MLKCPNLMRQSTDEIRAVQKVDLQGGVLHAGHDTLGLIAACSNFTGHMPCQGLYVGQHIMSIVSNLELSKSNFYMASFDSARVCGS